MTGIPKANDEQRALFKELIDFEGLWIYLHGSQADGTTTPFSDYDDLIIMPDGLKHAAERVDALNSALRSVEMRFQRLDPLQHHGHWLIWRSDLESYDASHIPIQVLRRAVVIQGPPEVACSVNFKVTKEGLRGNVSDTIRSIERFESQLQADSINLYNLKRLIGSLLIMPAYLAQLDGAAVDKPEALRRLDEQLSPEAVPCVRWASKVRDRWGELVDTLPYAVFKLTPHLFQDPGKYRRFANRFSPSPPASSQELLSLPADSISTLSRECRRAVDEAS